MNKEELQHRTKQFALRVITMSSSLPQNAAGKTIAHQIVRSATSVVANYQTACRARSRAEFTAKLGLILEETDETQFWLEIDLRSATAPSRQDFQSHIRTCRTHCHFHRRLKTFKPRFK